MFYTNLRTFLFSFIKCFILYRCAFIDYSRQEEWPGMCNRGRFQSPIEFSDKINYLKAEGHIHLMSVEYLPLKNIRLDFHHKNELSVSFKQEDFGSMKIEIGHVKLKYDLIQVKFHTPAEHVSRGLQGDVEMQLLHRLDKEYLHCNTVNFEDFLRHERFNLDDNEYLIVSVLFKEDKNKHSDKEIAKLKINTFQPMEGFDIHHYVTKREPYYFYVGSNTVPECEEPINWLVIEKPFPVGYNDLRIFQEIFKHFGYKQGNSRKVQDVHDRDVYYHSHN